MTNAVTLTYHFGGAGTGMHDRDWFVGRYGLVDGVHSAAGVVVPESQNVVGGLYDEGVAHGAGPEAVGEPVGVKDGEGDAMAAGICLGQPIGTASATRDDLGKVPMLADEVFEGFPHQGKVGKGAGAYDSEFHGGRILNRALKMGLPEPLT